MLVVIVIVGLLATIAIPNLISAHRKARCSRAASDSKTLVTQAILYGNDKGVYPTSVAVMRGAGYANMADVQDRGISRGNSRPHCCRARRPRQTDDVYMYSRGAGASGAMRRCRSRPPPETMAPVGFFLDLHAGPWSGTLAACR
ncbi:MAG: hypothetical protein MZW92_38525 [Comamonadaceae bacterium]|nr:hypothetical protein [Comamonadaceae bacterium]